MYLKRAGGTIVNIPSYDLKHDFMWDVNIVLLN